MVNPLKKIKEVELIENIARRFKVYDKDVVVSIGDDAAVVRASKKKYLLYTADMLVESVHFKKGEDPRRVGYKALAVCISDVAAMGGVPKYALVSVGLPRTDVDRLTRELFVGIKTCARKFNIDVIGGDTNRSAHLVISVFLVGEVEPDRLVLRSGAKTGDHIFVSGPLGGSLRDKHLTFKPKVAESRFLVENFKVTSMIDLSDGLAIDLNRLVFASRCGALIFENKIPKSKRVCSIDAALFDGEDFELLFTLSKTDAFKLRALMRTGQKGLKFYHIGKVTDLFRGVKMITMDGRIREITCQGFSHF